MTMRKAFLITVTEIHVEDDEIVDFVEDIDDEMVVETVLNCK